MPNLSEAFRLARLEVGNAARRRRHVPPWVLMELHGQITEFPAPPPFQGLPFLKWLRLPLPRPPISVSGFRHACEQLAFDPRVRGVVLDLRPAATASVYQSLRAIIANLRASGKHVVAYAESFGPFQYFLACACDAIIMPPAAEWAVLGLAHEHVFLKDALETLGIEAEVIHVSPFKAAGDALVRNDFSDESRAQAEWLIQAQYDELVEAIAAGRKLGQDRVRALIDGAPIGARQAVDDGLIDAALYLDQLDEFVAKFDPRAAVEPAPGLLARLMDRIRMRLEAAMTATPPDPEVSQPRRIGSHAEASGALLIKPVRYTARHIGVVAVEGMIVEGGGQVPSLPGLAPQLAGADPILQALRRAERDPGIAAVILYVNSPGGSALASDLIAREVERVQRRKPVVAYMGGTAASGGYYVAALARHIVAQPLTVTGSIGVILTKPNASGALGKLKLHASTIKRGARADAFGPMRGFTPDERQSATDLMNRVYLDFKRVVARGRGLDAETIEPICGGRVWTGRQALEHGLIDVLGDFPAALRRASELANLPADRRARAALVVPARHALLALPWRAILALVLDPRGAARRFFARPRAWLIAPFLPGIE